MDDQKNNTNNNNLNEFIQDDEEELSSGEYLGTFRWKKKLSFPKLIFVNDRLDQSYYGINKWADFFEKRINFEVEPHIIDALSYPLTIINSLLELQKVYLNFSLIYEKTINLIFIGASKKCEERIAIGSNYFDEIYYFLLLKTALFFSFLVFCLFIFYLQLPRNNVSYFICKVFTA